MTEAPTAQIAGTTFTPAVQKSYLTLKTDFKCRFEPAKSAPDKATLPANTIDATVAENESQEVS